MKITDVQLTILEDPEGRARGHRLVEVPNLRRVQYTHRGRPVEGPLRQAFVEVFTDEGISGRCDTGTMTPSTPSMSFSRLCRSLVSSHFRSIPTSKAASQWCRASMMLA